MSPRRRLVALLARVALPAWMAGAIVVGSAMMAEHWVGLRISPVDGRAVAALARTTGTDWTVAHVLYASCPCSRRLSAHLVARRALTETREVVLLVGHLPVEAALIAAGFDVVTVTTDDLARLGIDVAPAFVVVDDAGVVRHAGGYTARKQGLGYVDVDTIAALRRNDVVTQLPVLGCAMTRELQRALDPLVLKYRGVDAAEVQ